MSFTSLNILRGYKTYKNNVITEFYMPTLQQAVLYKRAVGFFSSTALIALSKGLSGLIRNGGKIKFIVSPLLQEEDIAAIERGYEIKGIVEKSLMREFHEPKTKSDEERLNWLAYLIAEGYLEIKVAFTPPSKITGMYHEKIGVLYDAECHKIAFTGSMNETINAFHNNYESIVVFCSWNESDALRTKDMEQEFDILWNNQERGLEVIPFPQVVKEKLKSYKKVQMNLSLDEMEMSEEIMDLQGHFPVLLKEDGNSPRIPYGVQLHPYQTKAIEKWAEKNYCGIFDMATGTGKTYTGLGAATYLFEKKGRVAIIIVCPYQHLVEQWVEDIQNFNLHPIIGYSASKQRDWKKRLESDILDFQLSVIDCFCFVTTNATFSSQFVKKQIDRLGKETLLIIDEAHNFGAYNLSQALNPKIENRLALSATFERHGDEEGTQTLYNYFGEKCIKYGLEQAIREDKLTPYYYHPKVVYLTDDELQKYRELSKKISKCCHKNKLGKTDMTEQGKMLLIERARLVAGASNKIEVLRELMKDYKDKSHILVYCGAAKIYNPLEDNSEEDVEGERQIVAVSKMLGNELGMKVTHFTSNESAKERQRIKNQFSKVDPYQALIAIKCLDEGVNIPSIKTAFILASSTNPKEYVQRRGRVLRKAPYKPYAVIYDFITLPRPLYMVTSYISEEVKPDLSLVRKEITRMKEFGTISKNSAESDQLINKIREAYNLNLIKEENEYDQF